MSNTSGRISFDFWIFFETKIKNYESMLGLLLVILVFILIPFKILSTGWTPVDDANRHVAFSTLDAKWSDILVIDEKFDTDHNAGWHQILRFLYKKCKLDKEDLMYFSVAGLFLLLNICGLIISPSPICWCLPLLILMNVDSGICARLLLGRPYIVSCAVTLLILWLWGVKKENGSTILDNFYAKYLLTILIFSLGVWIHGTWYIFLLIPFSFFLAGKTSDALKLTLCIVLATIIGAALTGNFTHFLYYHFAATYSIYSEPTYNWLLVSENATGCQSVYWAIAVALIVYLCNRKCGYKLKQLADDPVFIMVLLCWLGGIFVIRFWIDWGRMALLVWLTQRINELIKNSASLNSPRVRYSLFLFILTALTICFVNDADGRYTKYVLAQPIDFYNEATIDKLKGWEPGEGGIVYSSNMGAFYHHFYMYPTAKWKYILGFESGIMKQEDKATLRNIGYTGLEEAYTPWVNKMTEKDRLILHKKLSSFPQLEWERGSRTWWIGRLKKKSVDGEEKNK